MDSESFVDGMDSDLHVNRIYSDICVRGTYSASLVVGHCGVEETRASYKGPTELHSTAETPRVDAEAGRRPAQVRHCSLI